MAARIIILNLSQRKLKCTGNLFWALPCSCSSSNAQSAIHFQNILHHQSWSVKYSAEYITTQCWVCPVNLYLCYWNLVCRWLFSWLFFKPTDTISIMVAISPRIGVGPGSVQFPGKCNFISQMLLVLNPLGHYQVKWFGHQLRHHSSCTCICVVFVSFAMVDCVLWKLIQGNKGESQRGA